MSDAPDGRVSMALLGALAALAMLSGGAWLVWGDLPRRIAHAQRPVDPVEDSMRTVRIGDTGRTARLEVPSGYQRVGAQRWPLLVVLHTAEDRRGTGAAVRLDALRDDTRFVLFPEGAVVHQPPTEREGAREPDAKPPPPDRAWRPADVEADAEFVREAIAQIATEYRIDPARVSVLAEGDGAPVGRALACGGEGPRYLPHDGSAPGCDEPTLP